MEIWGTFLLISSFFVKSLLALAGRHHSRHKTLNTRLSSKLLLSALCRHARNSSSEAFDTSKVMLEACEALFSWIAHLILQPFSAYGCVCRTMNEACRILSVRSSPAHQPPPLVTGHRKPPTQIDDDSLAAGAQRSTSANPTTSVLKPIHGHFLCYTIPSIAISLRRD